MATSGQFMTPPHWPITSAPGGGGGGGASPSGVAMSDWISAAVSARL